MRKTRSSYIATFVRTCNVRLATDNVNASRHDENAQQRKRLITVSWTVAYYRGHLCICSITLSIVNIDASNTRFAKAS